MNNFRYLFLFFLSAISSFAQEELANVNISAVSMNGKIIGLNYKSSGGIQSINIFQGKRSRTFNYVGPQSLRFFQESEELDAEGRPIEKTIAVCNLPSKSGNYMLILSQILGDEERYNVTAISENWDEFPLGAYRFLNLAPFEIAIKIDKNIHRIKAQNFTDVQSQLSGSGNQEAIMISLPADGDPVKIFDGQMYHSDNIRMLYLIAPRPGGRQGRVTIVEIPQVAPSPN